MFWFCQWFIHILKTVHLQQLTELKGKQSSKLGMWEGYHLSKEDTRKGTFSAKVVCKRVAIEIEPRAGASLDKPLLSPTVPGLL